MDTNGLDHCAMLAKNNGLVGCLFHQDGSINTPTAVFVGKLVQCNANAVGNFRLAGQKHLFADDFAHKVSFAFVGDVVLFEVHLCTSEVLFEGIFQLFHTVVALCGNAEHLVDTVDLVEFSKFRQKFFLLGDINLCDNDNHRRILLGVLGDLTNFAVANSIVAIHHYHHAIHVVDGVVDTF